MYLMRAIHKPHIYVGYSHTNSLFQIKEVMSFAHFSIFIQENCFHILIHVIFYTLFSLPFIHMFQYNVTNPKH